MTNFITHTTFGTFLKFSVVGAGAASIYFFVMWIATDIFKFHYATSTSLAYLVSTVFHYIANRNFTFGVASTQRRAQIFRYLVVWAINYSITMLVVAVCVEVLTLSPYAGVCISILFTLLVGYCLGRYWVFQKKGVID